MRRLTSMLVMMAALVYGASAQREVQAFGVRLQYDPADFPGHSAKQEPKLTAKDNGTDIPVGVGPLRTAIILQGRGGRIDVIPLKDPSADNFGKAYPEVHRAAASVRSALNHPQKPDPKNLSAADLYCIDGEHAMRTRIQFVDGPRLSGFSFLTQYTQEELANPVNNEELTYVFLGLTRDRRHYVAAHIPLGHPSLPPGVKATGVVVRDAARTYMRRSESELAGFGETTFQPPLDHLRQLIRSIEVR